MSQTDTKQARQELNEAESAIQAALWSDKYGLALLTELETAREVVRAAGVTMPDLDHYVSTHGPGPDRRRDALRAALANHRRATS